MLDPRLLREQPDVVRRALEARASGAPIDVLLEQDANRLRVLRDVEELKARRNRLSQDVAVAKRQRQDATAMVEESRALGGRISEREAELRALDEALARTALQLPNLPHPSVPLGADAEANVELRRWGTPREFGFPVRPHWELGEGLGILDFERGAKLAKARFTVLWGLGARLERALAQFMLDLHTKQHGYQEVWVPHLVSAETMLKTGQLPKFAEGLFKTVEADEGRALYLIPTAEVSLTALHGGEVLPERTLPRRYTALTACYRREAGTYGKDMKGIFRNHQFDKVELVKITSADRSWDELESLVNDGESILQSLEIPYRVVERCAGDVGFSAAKGYDIEVWLPGQGRYREISSCSNYADFGGRRVDIRYKPEAGGKPEFCHTLNGSGLAVGRTLIAVLENYQEADGSVTVPKALRSYLPGIEKLVRAH